MKRGQLNQRLTAQGRAYVESERMRKARAAERRAEWWLKKGHQLIRAFESFPKARYEVSWILRVHDEIGAGMAQGLLDAEEATGVQQKLAAIHATIRRRMEKAAKRRRRQEAKRGGGGGTTPPAA